MTVFAISDTAALQAEVIAGAKALAERMGTRAEAIALDAALAEEASKLGVSEVRAIAVPEGTVLDDAAETVAGIVGEGDALIVGGNRRGKAIAARVAAIKGTSAVVDAKKILWEDGTLCVEHALYGGAANYTERVTSATAIVVAAPGLNEPAVPAGEQAAVATVDFVAPAVGVKLVGTKEKGSKSVDLTSSKVIVCCGRGITDRAGVEMAQELAAAIDGDIAFTRPLTEGAEPLSTTDDYIGVSGVQASPEFYIGVGVSGQTQHTMGVVESRVMVGINKDKNAPIFRQCDYGVVGDVYEVLPLLTQAIRG